MFNHACLPNCLWYIIDDYLFIYVGATQIEVGQELTISYCPLWLASLQERTHHLRGFGIDCCQCVLCLYDRQQGEDYEQQLKTFAHHRSLLRQKSGFLSIRLSDQYRILNQQFSDRPIGFLRELADLESLESQASFLDQLAVACRFNVDDPHSITNLLFLFGPHLQVLIDHLRHHHSSEDVDMWRSRLDDFYGIMTCNSPR